MKIRGKHFSLNTSKLVTTSIQLLTRLHHHNNLSHLCQLNNHNPQGQTIPDLQGPEQQPEPPQPNPIFQFHTPIDSSPPLENLTPSPRMPSAPPAMHLLSLQHQPIPIYPSANPSPLRANPPLIINLCQSYFSLHFLQTAA